MMVSWKMRELVLRIPTFSVATYHTYMLETHDGPSELRLNVQHEDPGI